MVIKTHKWIATCVEIALVLFNKMRYFKSINNMRGKREERWDFLNNKYRLFASIAPTSDILQHCVILKEKTLKNTH